jgi:hypothetical protein
MSHKHMHHQDTETTVDETSSDTGSQTAVTTLDDTQKVTRQKPGRGDVGLTWQPIFVLVVIGLGVLVVLGKILGVF